MNARAPVLHGLPDDAAVTEHLLRPVLEPDRAWRVAVGVCAVGTLLLLVLIGYTVATGIGVWGNNVPVGWGVSIVNFVWWGHAGALISAVLLLAGRQWRVSVGRIAETMALCSLAVSGIFPLLHLGRPWFFYWMVPYPGTLDVWPQFRSALTWDMVGILVLLTVSFLFWYLGALPDLAELRDRSSGRGRRLAYGVAALGWRGSAREWYHYRIANGLLAGLVAAAAVGMHSIASLDFATSVVPGWHSTVFPAAFVGRSLFSGGAMILLLVTLMRRWHDMGRVLTARHLDALSKLVLAGSWAVIYTYVVEVFTAWYTGSPYLRYTYLVERTTGTYAAVTWASVLLAMLLPQLFWSRRARGSTAVRVVVALAVLTGLWMERFLIVAGSLNRGFLPSAWHPYTPSLVEWGILAGSLSLFGLLFLLLIRIVPPVPTSELKEMRRGRHPEEA